MHLRGSLKHTFHGPTKYQYRARYHFVSAESNPKRRNLISIVNIGCWIFWSLKYMT